MKKKTFLLFLFLGFILLLTGCSNYSEINNVMIVDSIGIDKINNKYLVSFNAYVGKDKYKVYDVIVDDLDTSFNDIYLLVNKQIYLSHLNILFLSSSLDNNDILNIINTFNNRDDIRGSFLISMVNNYNSNIFSNKNIPFLLKNNYQELGNIYPTTFNDIISNYLDLSISYIPVINNKDLSILGMHSIFDEYRFYNIEESSYLNLLLNKINNYNFDINNSLVKLNNIDICYKVDENNIVINIKSIYISNLDKNNIIDYLNSKINTFLDSDINYNYFISLIKKYDYSYYKNNKNFTINYDVNIVLKKDEFSNIKGDDLVEKD